MMRLMTNVRSQVFVGTISQQEQQQQQQQLISISNIIPVNK